MSERRNEGGKLGGREVVSKKEMINEIEEVGEIGGKKEIMIEKKKSNEKIFKLKKKIEDEMKDEG